MKATVGLLALALLGGCAAALVAPTERDARAAGARWPGTTLRDLQRGRSLYLSRCGACHGLYSPAALAPERWPYTLDDMGPRAGLGDEERWPLERYLVTAAQPATPAR